MTIINYIRNLIKTCPYLDEYHEGIGVDYLKEDTVAYMIESVPADTVDRTYVDGTKIKQFVFNFASRNAYGSDVIENLDNIGFYEHFSDWLDKITENRDWPDMEDAKRTPVMIRATTSGYPYITDAQSAQYVIQCVFQYKQEV